MADLKTRTRPAAAYEADFHAWTREQAARLRDLRPNSIDWENVAEEIESLGRSTCPFPIEEVLDPEFWPEGVQS